jgi:DNA-binding MarR family transcriptional regulator
MAGARRAELLSAIQAAMAETQGQGAIFANAVAERLGLSSTEIETLGVLDTQGPLSAKAISEYTGLTSGPVTRMIDRLVSKAWVARREDPDDRRRVLVEFTPSGRRRTAPFYGPMALAASQALASYSDKDLELILGFMRRMREVGLAQTVRLTAAGRGPASGKSKAKS